MSAPVLDVQGMSVEIGLPAGTLRAVTDVDFSVRTGETFAIVFMNPAQAKPSPHLPLWDCCRARAHDQGPRVDRRTGRGAHGR